MKVVFVHGACVRDGAWWWQPAADALAERGIASEAPLLPSCGEAGTRGGVDGPGLAEDVAEVRNVLALGDEPTVAVGHSYGGIVLAEAAAEIDSVKHLLLISSYLPEPGESLSTFGPDEPAPFLAIDADAGTFTVEADALAERFLQDCSAEIQREARDKRADQSVSVVAEPVKAAAWKQLPTTYLVCADDGGTPAQAQREFAQRADRLVEIDAGHHPFISQPDAIRDLLLSLDMFR